MEYSTRNQADAIRAPSPSAETLSKGAGELGIPLSHTQLQQFAIYHRELADWNQRANLTSITAGLARGGSVGGDVGAGAGFPGLPLKLAFPEIWLTLVESVGKKARFLERMVDILELEGVEVLTGRAEELAHRIELRETFDLATCRGVAGMPVLLEYTLSYCAIGGRVVALKHGGLDQEIADASRAMEVLGGRLGETRPVTLEGLMDYRVVVSVEKVAPTPSAYPRRPGIPSKRPL